MKKILQKEDVEKALAALTAEHGKKPTVTALHSALNNRGSMTTLIKLVNEIEAEQRPPTEAGDTYKTFREIWRVAMDEGRKEAEAEIRNLTSVQFGLCSENERLDGALIAAQERMATLEREKSDLATECAQNKAKLENQLHAAQAGLVEANGRTSQAFERLSEAQVTHATALAALHADRDAAIQAQHTAELELATCKARLAGK